MKKVVKNKISIIIPVFNGKKFIIDAYENIVNQEIDDFEILFIDNNSTDNSLEIIQKLKEKDSKILVFKEKKQGAAATRNKGVKESNGEFIHFYDVDDRLFKDSYKVLKKVLIENPNVESVFGKLVKTNQKEINLSLNEDFTGKIEIHNNDDFELIWLREKSKLVGPPAFLHRRAVFHKIKGFKENLLIGEDGFFHVQLANECCIASIDRNIYQYFRHEASTISLENNKNKDRVFIYWDQLVNAYLPYSLETKTSDTFKCIVKKQVFSSIAKQLVLTKGLILRKRLFDKLKNELLPIKTPLLFVSFYKLLMIVPSLFLFKFFVFYIVTPYFNKICKS